MKNRFQKLPGRPHQPAMRTFVSRWFQKGLARFGNNTSTSLAVVNQKNDGTSTNSWKQFHSPITTVNFPSNSFSYRGSYFKYRGEGSQILWIRFGGGCRAGRRLMRRLICVWVRARKAGGGCWTGCRLRRRLMCVWVKVRRSSGGLSGRVSSEASSDTCTGEGSQIQGGCRAGCRLRRRLMCVYGWGFADLGGGCRKLTSICVKIVMSVYIIKIFPHLYLF